LVYKAIFEVFMAVKIQVYVFWVEAQCSDVPGYHRFHMIL